MTGSESVLADAAVFSDSARCVALPETWRKPTSQDRSGPSFRIAIGFPDQRYWFLKPIAKSGYWTNKGLQAFLLVGA
jgi:hypothetical protein